MTRNIKLTIAYDGTAYHGLQRQAGHITIQEVLEDRLPLIFGHGLSISAAGRTDAGVHALGQVASFRTEGRIPIANILPAAKSALPQDIAVLAAEEAGAEFHARYSAKGKEYLYKIAEKKSADPFLARYAWLMECGLDLPSMLEAAEALLGKQDFSTFRAAGGKPGDPERTVWQARFRREGACLLFAIRGDGFLYHMVRNIVGTLVEVGKGKMTPQAFREALLAKDRRQAGKTAPPQGLYLSQVFY
jgi:tRNA pseudouridine38-40 synthase